MCDSNKKFRPISRRTRELCLPVHLSARSRPNASVQIHFDRGSPSSEAYSTNFGFCKEIATDPLVRRLAVCDPPIALAFVGECGADFRFFHRGLLARHMC